MGVSVLMYHGLGDPPRPERTGTRYHIPAAALAQHLDRLEAAGPPVIDLDALLSGADRGVVLTFDDGEASCVQAAHAIAARRWRATMYVTAGFMDTAGYMTASDLRDLADAGFIIGAHGATHRYLTDVSDRDLDDELAGSKKRLEDAIGRPVVHMSLPGGRGDARVSAAARRAGYASIATSRVGMNGRRADPFELKRVAVVRGMPADKVAAFARGDRLAYARDAAVSGALGLAKKALGNQRYEKLRGAALGLLGKK